jgi:excisionase family DNA binding protein
MNTSYAASISKIRRVTLHKVSKQWTPDFISVGFIAKGCGVSNTTVLRWISTKQLPAFRLPGGHYRIKRDNLSEFLAKYHIPALYK